MSERSAAPLGGVSRLVVALAHLWALAAVAIALRVFLTPPALIESVPIQPIRYAVYATAVLAISNAAGSVLGVFLLHRTWLPVVYLWLVPFGIVLYPLVDPGAAHLLYVGVTSHFAGALAVFASALWMLGIAIGVALVFLSAGRLRPRRSSRAIR